MNLLTPQGIRQVSGSVWKPWVTMTLLLGDGVFGFQRSLELELEGLEKYSRLPMYCSD